jgi:hypothetical protein
VLRIGRGKLSGDTPRQGGSGTPLSTMQERDAAADTGFRGGEKHAAIENIGWNSSDGREEFTAGTIHCCTIHCFGNLVTRAVSMDMAASETRGTT